MNPRDLLLHLNIEPFQEHQSNRIRPHKVAVRILLPETQHYGGDVQHDKSRYSPTLPTPCDPE